MQPVTNFFRPLPGKPAARRRQSPPADCSVQEAAPVPPPSEVGEEPAAGGGGASSVQQRFSRKRKGPSGGGAPAAPLDPMPPASGRGQGALAGREASPGAASQQQQLPPPQLRQPQQQRQLTQLYLDVGQNHFHSFRCPTCGMLYARGTEADERLHAAFHASATEGPRYQGWQGEKVAQLDGSRGRVLLFSTADQQGRGRKQLQELCGFLEEQMGLAQGWLLRVPLTLLLYVNTARRIQAVVAAETIREAYAVKPSLPPVVVQSMRSCGSVAAEAAAGAAGAASGGGQGAAAHEAGKRQAALPAAAVAHAAATCGDLSLLSVTLSSGAATATAECGRGSGAGAGQAEPAAAAVTAVQYPEHEAQQGAQQQQQQQGQPLQEEQQQHGPPPPPLRQEQRSKKQQQGEQEEQQTEQQRSELQQLRQKQGEQRSKQQRQPPQQQSQQQQQQPAAPLALDRSRRVRAVCGVRLMWTSTEVRRRGLATRLLDCCRCQVMPGYVVPRHELAFSAPTDDGRRFVEAYTGTRRFLMYEG